MPIRRQAMQKTPFGEINIGHLNRVATDIDSGVPAFTGSVVLLDMLDSCNIPGYFPKNRNIFGRHIPSEVVKYAKVHELIKILAGQNPYGEFMLPQTLAEAYNNLAYRIANGIRGRTRPHEIVVNGSVYYIHSVAGRGISMYSRVDGEPVTHRDVQVKKVSGRGLFPQIATATVDAVVRAGESEEARMALEDFGTRVQMLGTNMLAMCDAPSKDQAS